MTGKSKSKSKAKVNPENAINSSSKRTLRRRGSAPALKGQLNNGPDSVPRSNSKSKPKRTSSAVKSSAPATSRSSSSSSSSSSSTSRRPTYLQMVLTGIAEIRKARVSKQVIEKCLEERLGHAPHRPALTQALDRATEMGLLERDKNSYRITSQGRATSKQSGTKSRSTVQRVVADGKRSRTAAQLPRLGTKRHGGGSNAKAKAKAQAQAGGRLSDDDDADTLASSLISTAELYRNQTAQRMQACQSCLRGAFREFEALTLLFHPEPARFEAKFPEGVVVADQRERATQLLATFAAQHGSSLTEFFRGKPHVLRAAQSSRGFEMCEGHEFPADEIQRQDEADGSEVGGDNGEDDEDTVSDRDVQEPDDVGTGEDNKQQRAQDTVSEPASMPRAVAAEPPPTVAPLAMPVAEAPLPGEGEQDEPMPSVL